MPHFADFVFPMQKLVTRYMKVLKDFQWTKEAETSFDEIKEKISSCVALNINNNCCGQLHTTPR